VRLGLETSDGESQRRLGGKVRRGELEQALDNLEAAGFQRSGVGVYVMVGMPGQQRAEVDRTIRDIKNAGARPRLAHYSPVPGSPMFSEAQAAARPGFDLEEPLFHNPTLGPCAGDELGEEALQELRQACS